MAGSEAQAEKARQENEDSHPASSREEVMAALDERDGAAVDHDTPVAEGDPEQSVVGEEPIKFADGETTTRSKIEGGDDEPPKEKEVVEKKAEEKAEEKPEAKTEKPKRHRSAQFRINQAVKKQREAERVAAAEKKRAQELEERIAKLEHGDTETADDGLTDEQRSTIETMRDDGYDDAVIDIRRDSFRAINKVDAKKETVEEPAETGADNDFAERVSEWATAAEQDDFVEVTQAEDLAITTEMAEYLMSSDVGHDLAYHLGKHPDKARAIAERIKEAAPLGPGAASYAAYQELGQLEAELESDSTEGEIETTPDSKQEPPQRPPAKRVSQAPDPIEPINTGPGAPEGKDPDDMTQLEYEAWRRKQTSARQNQYT